MRKSAMRVLACSLAVMVAFSTLAPATTARAENSIPAAREGAESGVLPVSAAVGNALYLTADMADKGQITIFGGTYERIVVPKEIGANRITFDKVKVGELIVESGSSAYVLLREVEAEKVTVEEPKLKEIDWTELKHLLADAQTSQQAIEYYTRVQAENSRYLSSSPHIVIAGKTVVDILSADAGVRLNLQNGEVGSLCVKANTKLMRTEITVENYQGDITYSGSDSFGIVDLKLRDSDINKLTVAESCGSNYLLVNGRDSSAGSIEVAGNAKVSLNIPADALTVTADARNASVDVLNKIDNMSVAADNAKVEIAPIGSVASAEVSGNKVSIGGTGALDKAVITGEGAYVSTKGTDVEGENTYIPPVYTAPSVTVTSIPTPTETPVIPIATPTPTPDVTGTPKPIATPTPTPGVTPGTGSAVFIPSGTGDRVTFTGETAELSEAKVGDTVCFGSYEQDNNSGNGKEAIEWLVLDKQDGKLLLLSKDALDYKTYNEKLEDVTWETCTLRSWLNGEFYNTAFRQTEQERIATTRVKNEDNPYYETEGGNDTEDKVFLLSIGEVLNYFDPDPYAEDPARWAKVTEYAKAQHGYVSSDSGYGQWWLRSPGLDGISAADINTIGEVHQSGRTVYFHAVVRPAFWLNLVTPETTPTVTPETTPTVTPEVTPTVTPETTPTVTPEVTPTLTPTPAETPTPTPTVIPETTPTVTPETTPTVTPEVTPTVTPEVTPPVTPTPPVTGPTFVSWADAGLEDHVMDWKDVALEAAMREITEITSRDIMLSDVWEKRTLSLSRQGIVNISALAELTNLKSLSLSDNTIGDISALSGLTNLTSLSLSDNTISDISALSGLTNLTSLSLSDNTISDISALSGLTNLTELHLFTNTISDISALSGLTNLTHLYLHRNAISDISALSNLTKLETLYLQSNTISDISALSDLTKLETLYLSDNTISDISALSGLTNLTHLYLSDNTISDISALSDLMKLGTLWLDNNTISDISALSGLTNLMYLILRNNTISDISALSDLTKLTRLSLEYTTISDISALSGLTNLETLYLHRNAISDISALSDLTKLETLWLDNNTISDISALSSLTKLKTLYLQNNTISDISTLSGLKELRTVYLSGNPITDYSPVDHVEDVYK